MSEKICETCGRRLGVLSSECNGYNDPDGSECLRLGHERTLARADRYEAEFSACKALLIAAEARAEEAERRARGWTENAVRAGQLTAAVEREAASLRAALEWIGNDEATSALILRTVARDALAALPVEPARRQVTENANALGAPSARSTATPEEER
jgi:hypothetical protein